MQLGHILYFILSCLVLVKSADMLVGGLTKVARYLKFNEFLIGFLIVGFATSIPELFVGVTSALNGIPALSLGNVIGANIIDMTIVIGIAALLNRGIKVESKTIRKDTIYTFLITMLPLILMLDHTISRLDGIILLSVFVLYASMLMRQERIFHEHLEPVTKLEMLKNILKSLIALLFLFVSAKYAVQYALLMATDFNVPPILIGLIFISLGTSLPELTFETRSVLKKHGSMALGDLLGSIAVNTTFVLGVVALIEPIHANFTLFMTACVFMIVVGFIFMTFVESEQYISWQEGVALIFLYVLFIIVEMNIQMLEVAPH